MSYTAAGYALGYVSGDSGLYVEDGYSSEYVGGSPNYAAAGYVTKGYNAVDATGYVVSGYYAPGYVYEPSEAAVSADLSASANLFVQLTPSCFMAGTATLKAFNTYFPLVDGIYELEIPDKIVPYYSEKFFVEIDKSYVIANISHVPFNWDYDAFIGHNGNREEFDRDTNEIINIDGTDWNIQEYIHIAGTEYTARVSNPYPPIDFTIADNVPTQVSTEFLDSGSARTMRVLVRTAKPIIAAYLSENVLVQAKGFKTRVECFMTANAKVFADPSASVVYGKLWNHWEFNNNLLSSGPIDWSSLSRAGSIGYSFDPTAPTDLAVINTSDSSYCYLPYYKIDPAIGQTRTYGCIAMFKTGPVLAANSWFHVLYIYNRHYLNLSMLYRTNNTVDLQLFLGNQSFNVYGHPWSGIFEKHTVYVDRDYEGQRIVVYLDNIVVFDEVDNRQSTTNYGNSRLMVSGNTNTVMTFYTSIYWQGLLSPATKQAAEIRRLYIEYKCTIEASASVLVRSKALINLKASATVDAYGGFHLDFGEAHLSGEAIEVYCRLPDLTLFGGVRRVVMQAQIVPGPKAQLVPTATLDIDPYRTEFPWNTEDILDVFNDGSCLFLDQCIGGYPDYYQPGYHDICSTTPVDPISNYRGRFGTGVRRGSNYTNISTWMAQLTTWTISFWQTNFPVVNCPEQVGTDTDLILGCDSPATNTPNYGFKLSYDNVSNDMTVSMISDANEVTFQLYKVKKYMEENDNGIGVVFRPNTPEYKQTDILRAMGFYNVVVMYDRPNFKVYIDYDGNYAENDTIEFSIDLLSTFSLFDSTMTDQVRFFNRTLTDEERLKLYYEYDFRNEVILHGDANMVPVPNVAICHMSASATIDEDCGVLAYLECHMSCTSWVADKRVILSANKDIQVTYPKPYEPKYYQTADVADKEMKGETCPLIGIYARCQVNRFLVEQYPHNTGRTLRMFFEAVKNPINEPYLAIYKDYIQTNVGTLSISLSQLHSRTSFRLYLDLPGHIWGYSFGIELVAGEYYDLCVTVRSDGIAIYRNFELIELKPMPAGVMLTGTGEPVPSSQVYITSYNMAFVQLAHYATPHADAIKPLDYLDATTMLIGMSQYAIKDTWMGCVVTYQHLPFWQRSNSNDSIIGAGVGHFNGRYPKIGNKGIATLFKSIGAQTRYRTIDSRPLYFNMYTPMTIPQECSTPVEEDAYLDTKIDLTKYIRWCLIQCYRDELTDELMVVIANGNDSGNIDLYVNGTFITNMAFNTPTSYRITAKNGLISGRLVVNYEHKIIIGNLTEDEILTTTNQYVLEASLRTTAVAHLSTNSQVKIIAARDNSVWLKAKATVYVYADKLSSAHLATDSEVRIAASSPISQFRPIVRMNAEGSVANLPQDRNWAGVAGTYQYYIDKVLDPLAIRNLETPYNLLTGNTFNYHNYIIIGTKLYYYDSQYHTVGFVNDFYKLVSVSYYYGVQAKGVLKDGRVTAVSEPGPYIDAAFFTLQSGWDATIAVKPDGTVDIFNTTGYMPSSSSVNPIVAADGYTVVYQDGKRWVWYGWDDDTTRLEINQVTGGYYIKDILNKSRYHLSLILHTDGTVYSNDINGSMSTEVQAVSNGNTYKDIEYMAGTVCLVNNDDTYTFIASTVSSGGDNYSLELSTNMNSISWLTTPGGLYIGGYQRVVVKWTATTVYLGFIQPNADTTLEHTEEYTPVSITNVRTVRFVQKWDSPAQKNYFELYILRTDDTFVFRTTYELAENRTEPFTPFVLEEPYRTFEPFYAIRPDRDYGYAQFWDGRFKGKLKGEASISCTAQLPKFYPLYNYEERSHDTWEKDKKVKDLIGTIVFTEALGGYADYNAQTYTFEFILSLRADYTLKMKNYHYISAGTTASNLDLLDAMYRKCQVGLVDVIQVTVNLKLEGQWRWWWVVLGITTSGVIVQYTFPVINEGNTQYYSRYDKGYDTDKYVFILPQPQDTDYYGNKSFVKRYRGYINPGGTVDYLDKLGNIQTIAVRPNE